MEARAGASGLRTERAGNRKECRKLHSIVLISEVNMSKTEAIEIFAKSVFNEEKKVIGTDELNELIEKAESQQERDFYLYIYSYLLRCSQREVIKNGKF